MPGDGHDTYPPKDFVIPAQAGIHFATANALAWWIPASAGMTKY